MIVDGRVARGDSRVDGINKVGRERGEMDEESKRACREERCRRLSKSRSMVVLRRLNGDADSRVGDGWVRWWWRVMVVLVVVVVGGRKLRKL